MSVLLAKSDGTTLKAHLEHVAMSSEALAAGFGIDAEIAYQAGLLHDLGKGHPAFQNRIRCLINKEEYNPRGIWAVLPFRHEIASLVFLPCFERKIWSSLVEMVVAHHKAIDDNKKGLHGLVLERGRDYVIELYLDKLFEWVPATLLLLKEFKHTLEIHLITLESAKEALSFAINCCEQWSHERRMSDLRGLLMAADHMTSALEQNQHGFHLPPLFNIPDLSKFNRQSLHFPLSLRKANDDRPHTLVVAPTGAGKTDYLMRRCRGRVFYTLPFQASIDAMYRRFAYGDPSSGQSAMIPESDKIRIHRLHGASKLPSLDNQSNKENLIYDQDTILQPFAGAAVKVMTPYQLAAVALAAPGFEALAIDLKGQDVILDEIHTYQKVGQALVHGLIRGLVQLGCRIHVGSATIPSALYDALLMLLGGPEKTLESRLSQDELATYTRHKVYKHLADTDIIGLTRPYLEAGHKVLLVANTIAKSQEWAQLCRNALPEITDNQDTFVLLHSRFKRQDRIMREERLQQTLEPGSHPCICIATQVVEVSLDISFSTIITQVSPIDSLIQRLGRVNRRRSHQIGLADVHILGLPDNISAKPYDKDVLEATLSELPDRGEPLDANTLQEIIDRVYPHFSPFRIEGDLAWSPDGTFQKKALCNGTTSLTKLLEIDTAAAILHQDIEAYKEGDFMSRRMLEIPVPYNTVAHRGLPRLLGYGDEPFQVNQSVADYEQFGLRFTNEEDQLNYSFL